VVMSEAETASRYYRRWSSVPIMVLYLPVPSYLELSESNPKWHMCLSLLN
jgi:hypothetical protein